MIVLMGGSGSTGSSLLKNILNRSDTVFAGEESNLFCKKELYTHFSKYKNRITKRGLLGLRNYGWHIYNGIDLHTPEYNLSTKQLQNTIDHSKNFIEFTQSLKTHFLEGKDGIWLEKTPANATSFRDFLDLFDNVKVIHIVRHPQDTIASLISRGYEPYYATGIYLINTAAALQYLGHPYVLTVKYEDLVLSPHAAVGTICEFLDIPYSEEMIKSQGEKIAVSQLEGWNYDETAGIGKKSLNRFESINIEAQRQINMMIKHIKVSKSGVQRYQCPVQSIDNIGHLLGYEMNYSKGHASGLGTLRRSLISDRWRRVRRGYETGWHYPLIVE